MQEIHLICFTKPCEEKSACNYKFYKKNVNAACAFRHPFPETVENDKESSARKVYTTGTMAPRQGRRLHKPGRWAAAATGLETSSVIRSRWYMTRRFRVRSSEGERSLGLRARPAENRISLWRRTFISSFPALRHTTRVSACAGLNSITWQWR